MKIAIDTVTKIGRTMDNLKEERRTIVLDDDEVDLMVKIHLRDTCLKLGEVVEYIRVAQD
jgi:hypothetical protein